MKTYIEGNDKQLQDLAEAIGRRYAVSIGKPWPIPPDAYGPGRQPDNREAYYERVYLPIAEPDRGLPKRLEVDDTTRALAGQSVRITDGTLVTLDFAGEKPVPEKTP